MTLKGQKGKFPSHLFDILSLFLSLSGWKINWIWKQHQNISKEHERGGENERKGITYELEFMHSICLSQFLSFSLLSLVCLRSRAISSNSQEKIEGNALFSVCRIFFRIELMPQHQRLAIDRLLCSFLFSSPLFSSQHHFPSRSIVWWLNIWLFFTFLNLFWVFASFFLDSSTLSFSGTDVSLTLFPSLWIIHLRFCLFS